MIIFFYKCDVTCSLPPPPATNCRTFSDPLPIERDVLYGRPHRIRRLYFDHDAFTHHALNLGFRECVNASWSKYRRLILCMTMGVRMNFFRGEQTFYVGRNLTFVYKTKLLSAKKKFNVSYVLRFPVYLD